LDHTTLEALLLANTSGIFCWNPSTATLSWSEQLRRNLGYEITPDDSVRDLVHYDDLGALGETLDAASNSPGQTVTVDLRLHSAGGSFSWFRANCFRFSDGKREPVVLGCLHAIDEEVQLREALERTDRLFNAFLDNCPASAYIKKTDGTNVYGNRLAAQWFGLSREEYARTNAQEFFTPEVYEKVRAQDEHVAKTGETVTFTGKITSRTGEDRIIRASKFAVEDPMTGETMVGGFSIDLTREKEAEEQVFHLRKLDALGQLVGGVAHDFNNSLAVMLGNLELLQEESDPEQCRLLMHEIHLAIERSRNLTRTLLVYGRRGAMLEPTSLDLSTLLESVVALLRRTIPETISIRLRIDGSLGRVWADKSSVEDMLINLALNSRDAMPNGGAMTFSAKTVPLQGIMNPHLRSTGRSDSFVVVEVADTGCGIPVELQERVFEPFFTTKPVDKGTGLGLSMVQSYMTQLGGSLDLESTPNFGTAFRLYFPVTDAPEFSAKSPVEKHQSLSQHVLLVEDDPGVLQVTKRQLELIGCTVTAARNGAEAVRIFESDDTIDAVITDMVMPGAIRGVDLAKRVEASRPGTPVIFVSGYPINEYGDDETEAMLKKIIMKPVSRAQFVEALLAARNK
jgi:PAS domain S-box-containing protein